MSERIEARFAALAKAGRKGLITFVMGGDPDLTASANLIAALPKAGADIIEIGFPFSDPMADGPVIQAAGLRALRAGTSLHDVIVLAADFRKQDIDTPIVLMGYYNPVYRYGIDAFCKAASKAGVDGIILVDLPPEEEEEFVNVATPYDIRLIRLLAPTTDDNRLAALTCHAGGFLYYISVMGITGGKSADNAKLEARVRHIQSRTSLPLAVGFGIKTPEQARQVAAYSDAVVVGSALVDVLAHQSTDVALDFVKSLRNAIDRPLQEQSNQ